MARICTLTPLILVLLAMLAAPVAAQGNFTVVEVHWTNRVGGHNIYPGSQGVTYVITMKYTGSEEIEGVVACLVNPPSITPSDGYSLCAVAETPSRAPAATVNPGDEILFVYHIDVSRGAQPGLYGITVKVSYRIAASGESRSEYVPGASIYISLYPAPSLRVLDVYWEPGGYPGTQDTTLHVVLENIGPRVYSGFARLELTRGVFYPTVLRTRLGPIEQRQIIDLAFNPISINSSSAPGDYRAGLYMRLSLETEDGVRYSAGATLTLYIHVSEGPPVNVTLVDYGFEGLAAPGTRDASIFVTLSNREPGVTVEAVYAKLVLLSGATAANGSRILYHVDAQRIPYGSTATIVFRGIDVNDENVETVLEVELLVSREGAEYWTRISRRLVIHAHWEPGLRLIGYGWSGSPPYPATEGATYTVVLGVVGYERVAGGLATLSLPQGFEPRNSTIEVAAAAPGSTIILRFTGISVAGWLSPGCYQANLTLNILLVDEESGARRNASVRLPLAVCVEKPPSGPLRLLGVWWDGGIAYANSTGNTLVLAFENVEPGVNVEDAWVRVRLPPGVTVNGYNEVNLTLGSLAYGSITRLTIDDVSVTSGISGRLPLIISIEGLASLSGNEYRFKERIATSITVSKPELNLSLVYYSWNGPVVNGTVGARVRIVLASSSLDRVTQLRLEWVPIEGVSLLEPGVQVIDSSIGFGSSISLDSPRMMVSSTAVRLELRIYARLERGDVTYTASKKFTLLLYANQTLPAPIIDRVEVLYNGEPAVLAPGERGVTLRIIIYNPTPYTLASISGSLVAPFARVESIGGTCLNGVAPGSLCTLDFTLNTSSMMPVGEIHASLRLWYSVAQNGYTARYENVYSLSLRTVNPASLAPRLTLVSVYWGEGRPEPVYPNAGLTPLTVVVLNAGRWEARGVTVEAWTVAGGVEPVSARAVCASTLAPGTACTATLYYLVGSVKPGQIVFRVRIGQIVYTYGLNYNVTIEKPIHLEVLNPPMGGGVRVVSYGWENDWPVYPGTSNAVYQVVLANLEPYQLLGVNVTLLAPRGIEAEEAYIPGPIDSGATATVNIKLNVSSNVKPGCYRATLVAVYALRVPGSTGYRVEETPVEVCISSPLEAASIVSVYWSGGATGPGSMGARLLIVIRNDEVPEMRGIVARVWLPRGMSFAPTNESIAAIPVTVAPAPLPVQQGGGAGLPPGLERLLAAIQAAGNTRGSAQTAVAPKGSFIIVEVPVNIYGVKPGSYKIRVQLDYIDQWGSRHTYEASTTVRVLGAPRLVEARMPPVVDVSGGYARVKLSIVNVGSGPIYSVYVYLVPKIPLLLPQPAIFYIPVLRPGEVEKLNLTLFYNPKGLATWGQESSPGYTTVPFTIGFVYSDAAGAIHSMNYTTVVQVEPFVRLVLGPDTKAEWRKGVLTVGGTLINTGTATAHSVEIRVYADGRQGYTFLGDLDPGDQTAFRIDLEGLQPVERVNLTVSYIDVYNRAHSASYVIPVKVYEERRTATASVEAGIQVEPPRGWVAAPVAAAVAAAVIFMLARRVKR